MDWYERCTVAAIGWTGMTDTIQWTGMRCTTMYGEVDWYDMYYSLQ